MKYSDLISLGADIATTISVIVALICFYLDRKRNNRIATLEAYDRLQCDVFDELNVWSPKEIKETCQNRRSDAYKKLSGYLARIEHFCAGVNMGVYDYEIFYSVAHGYFDGDSGMLYIRLLPIIGEKT